MRVAVTAGYGRSLHARALVEQLARHDCQVVLGLEVSVWTWKRLRFYLRQIGPTKLLQKARAKLAPGGAQSTYGGEVAPLEDYCRSNEIRSATFREACQLVGARHALVRSLNHAACLTALGEAKVDWVVYAGGGILHDAFLDVPKHGVLNAHSGTLPAFRGMNVAEWSLLHGVPPEVCVIRVERGIDTGSILYRYPIPPDAWSSIPHGRGAAARASVEALLETVKALQQDTVHPETQRVEDGRQFFVLPDPLLEVLDEQLQRGTRPQQNPVHFRFVDKQQQPADGYL